MDEKEELSKTMNALGHAFLDFISANTHRLIENNSDMSIHEARVVVATYAMAFMYYSCKRHSEWWQNNMESMLRAIAEGTDATMEQIEREVCKLGDDFITVPDRWLGCEKGYTEKPEESWEE